MLFGAWGITEPPVIVIAHELGTTPGVLLQICRAALFDLPARLF
jgi:hypothetical protein